MILFKKQWIWLATRLLHLWCFLDFLSFEIGQWYFVCGCMTIRRCVVYRNDLCVTLTFDLKVTYLERQKCYGPDKKLLFKKPIIWPWGQRSKVKVTQRSLWYVTHRLMVMHPHTNYHRPTLKDKNVMAFDQMNLTCNSAVASLMLSRFFIFRDRSMIFRMWVHDHKAVK
jgi:hypothetical protein